MTAPLAQRSPARGLLPPIVSIALALAVGAIGGFATASNIPGWYAGVHKPPFNPPNAIFGPVWTTLYILMALAAWRVWRVDTNARARRTALGLYAVQLALNLAWSLIFFGLHRPGWAFGDIAVLFAAIIATALAFARVDRLAGAMLIPYAAWVAFASVLNFEIWRLN